jgi:DNA polymerase III gamma/tau subunit
MIPLTINPVSKKRIDMLILELPQSIILSGENGVGLFTIALSIAGKNLIQTIVPLNTDGEIDRLKGTISVDVIRTLYELTRTKSLSRRVIIIDDANMMSHSAQASLLKLLEEPSANTHFLLTSHAPQQLSATILSRVQLTHVHTVTRDQTETILNESSIMDTKRRAQLLFIAEGRPAEIYRLINDISYFSSQAAIMTDARDLLTKKSYEKLLIVNRYASDRNKSVQLIDSAISIARRNVSTNAQDQLILQLKKLLLLRDRLTSNANAKLQMTRFVL